MFDILVYPFLLSVVLVGIHSFYGLEIIKRGIIFTDLAIGQWAALGTALAIVLNVTGSKVYILSLTSALIAGVTIAAGAKREHPEAFIGLLYATGMSASVLLLSHSPEGTEAFERLIAVDILFVKGETVFFTAVLYAAIALTVAFSYATLKSRKIKEVIFFASFAVTVTSSVKTAGVLTVFAILVAPAYVFSRIDLPYFYKLAGAWIYGSTVNAASVYLSYAFDLPTGYTTVFLHSFLALLAGGLLSKVQNRAKIT